MGIPTLIQSRAVPLEGFHNQLDCREQWEGQLGAKIYTGVLFAATFLVPFTALTYLYVSIAVKAFRHVIPGNADASRDQLQLRNKIRVGVGTHANCTIPHRIHSIILGTNFIFKLDETKQILMRLTYTDMETHQLESQVPH